MAKKVKKLHVKVKPMRLEGLPAVPGDVTAGKKSTMIEVKWKGPVTGFGMVPFWSNHLINRTSIKPVVGDRHVEWDEEFEHICCLAGPWNISFYVLYGEKIDSKNRKALVGKASLDLSELASNIESTVERKIKIPLKGLGVSTESTLVVSVTFSEVRNELDSPRLARNSLNSGTESTMANNNGSESEPSSSPATESSSGGLSPVVDSGSSSSPDSRSKPSHKTGLFSWKRRRLSFSSSRKREPRDDEGTKISAEAAKPEESKTSIETNKWETKDLVSRDGRSKLRSEVFFASLDQRSEQAAGEAACAAVAVVMAHWLGSNSDFTPSAPEFDSIIKQGSALWQTLCNDESYLRLFPNKHFDLETIVSAKLRPVRVCPDKSFTGVFSPEKFESLKGLMSFDEIWGDIEKDVSGINRGESRVYIVSWNDHFFVMKADLNGYFIIDSLGERLFEGCKQAYILKFDDSSLIFEKEEKAVETREEEEDPNPNSEEEEGKDEDEEEEERLVLRGKECCREYIKRFLAAIPVSELEAKEKKGTVVDVSVLHEKLQFDLHHISLIH